MTELRAGNAVMFPAYGAIVDQACCGREAAEKTLVSDHPGT
jgi:hypothetical protein